MPRTPKLGGSTPLTETPRAQVNLRSNADSTLPLSVREATREAASVNLKANPEATIPGREGTRIPAEAWSPAQGALGRTEYGAGSSDSGSQAVEQPVGPSILAQIDAIIHTTDPFTGGDVHLTDRPDASPALRKRD